VLWHRVTNYTLCPLGEPEIAIGHEPRIEPWFIQKPVSLAALSNSMAWPPSSEQPYENGQQVNLLQRNETTVGWISRKNLDAPVEAELFFLTSLFIELIEDYFVRFVDSQL
jgi:hypothetical protein